MPGCCTPAPCAASRTWDVGVLPPTGVRVAAALSIVLWIVRDRVRPPACLHLNRPRNHHAAAPRVDPGSAQRTAATAACPGLVGFRVVALEEGMLARSSMSAPELLAPNGFLHAATVIALADTACGYGCIAHLPPGAENFTTIELKCQLPGHRARGHDRVRRAAGAPRQHDAGLGRGRHAQGRRQARSRCSAARRCVLWPSSRQWIAPHRGRRIAS